MQARSGSSSETTWDQRLAAFADAERLHGKGPLAVALFLTRVARNRGLPLDPAALRAKSKGQVSGLSKAAVQAILKEYGIDRVLAEEGGRTSRRSMANMERYVDLLNTMHDDKDLDLNAVEAWWVDRVRQFFASQPLHLRLDPSKSLGAAVRDLLAQAERRQREATGTMYVGIVLQHLVGAKLELVVGGVEHHGASVADHSTGRDADFTVGDVAVHVTAAPGEALIRKCQRNLDNGQRPLVVTTPRGVTTVQELAEQAGIVDRVDVLDAEQFLAANIHEHGKFDLSGSRQSAADLVKAYNRIIVECETDPSLRVEVGS